MSIENRQKNRIFLIKSPISFSFFDYPPPPTGVFRYTGNNLPFLALFFRWVFRLVFGGVLCFGEVVLGMKKADEKRPLIYIIIM